MRITYCLSVALAFSGIGLNNPSFLQRFICRSRFCTTPFAQPNFNTRSNADAFVSNLIADVITCTSVSCCLSIHAQVLKFLSYRHGFIGDQLVSAYMRLGCEEHAEKLFDEIPNKDLISWNSLITGYSRRSCLVKCLNALSRMRLELGMQPNDVTVISIISVCNHVRVLNEGKFIHGIALKLGMLAETKVNNALINFYGMSGCLIAACRLFEAMPVQNLVSWNSMIAIQTQNGFSIEGLYYFNVMKRAGINSDQATILTVLQACENIGRGKPAQSIHGSIIRYGFNANVAILTGLLDLYAKLGRLKDSHDVFREITYPDRVAWTAMLAGYAVHGRGRRAVEHFELMVKQGVAPDHVTFTHLISACSHSGLVKEGKHYFKIMSQVYGVEPKLDHYSCMVDLLGRSGLLNDAYEMIKLMPLEPNAAIWGALLGACRIFGNIELGKEVAELLIVLDPWDPRNYIMLSNILSAARLWKDAAKVRVLMKERGLMRSPGCSYIEYGDEIHQFLVGDRSHPESEKIHKKLEDVMQKIREAGFVSRTESVLHDVDEEVKEDMINQHSEKLAIAFGLLVTKRGMPLVITKNLRICCDCHNTAKFISLIEKRTIIIRDSKRFHHFENGLCSCGDYW